MKRRLVQSDGFTFLYFSTTTAGQGVYESVTYLRYHDISEIDKQYNSRRGTYVQRWIYSSHEFFPRFTV